ncbi:MAG: sodium:proton antiporter [Bacteroidetes bacterium]|nr:MAG: sodium:proton antiporter [Bacteroidota bacterium]
MYNSIIILLAISSLFLLINAKLLKLPTSIGLLILGMLSSVILLILKACSPDTYAHIPHILEQLNFNYFLMQIILPFLLFAGAIHVDISELKKQKISVFVFSIFSTLISTIVVGYLSYLAFNMIGIDLPLMYCMLLGALISPTDPIAVLSIFKSYNVRSSLSIKVEGESLFNDGVGVVIFLTISGIIAQEGGGMEVGEIASLFLGEVFGGIGFGLLVGWIAIKILKQIEIPKYAIQTTILITTICYALAGHIEVSGPLAMVAAGLLIGNYLHTKAKPDIKREISTSWEVIDDVFNSMLFVLMGFQMSNLDMDVVSISAGIAMIIIVILARFISVSIPYSIIAVDKHKARFIPGLKEVTILTWSGLRGGLAFALALSLIDAPGGEFIIFITYVVAAFSIIVQGLSIGKLVKILKI